MYVRFVGMSWTGKHAQPVNTKDEEANKDSYAVSEGR